MAVQSTNHMMTLDRYYYTTCSGQECCFETFPEPESYFFSNDEAAWLWFNWRGARPGDSFSMVTFSPGGALYDHFSSDSLITREDGCLLLSFSINGSAPEHLPGDWRMEVAIDGDHLFSQSFKIVTGNRDTYIANKTMTLYPDISGDCTIPPSNYVFYEFDEGAYFWFYFNSAGIGDDLRRIRVLGLDLRTNNRFAVLRTHGPRHLEYRQRPCLPNDGAGIGIGEFVRMTVREASDFLEALDLAPFERRVAHDFC